MSTTLETVQFSSVVDSSPDGQDREGLADHHNRTTAAGSSVSRIADVGCQASTRGIRGLPPLWLPRGVEWSGRECGLVVDGLKLDRGELAEAALATSAVVGPFDPGHDRQA